MLGKTFSRLTVVSGPTQKDGKRHWECVCTCGKTVLAGEWGLKNENNRSCGGACYSKTRLSEEDPRYRRAVGCWRSMKQRVRTREPYTSLGLDDRWAHDYDSFLADVGLPPTEKHTLDRINNNKGYYPGNVRWATAKEQSHNRRDNWVVSGEHIMDMARRTGIGHNTLRWRIRQNWPIEQLTSKPNKALKLEDRTSN